MHAACLPMRRDASSSGTSDRFCRLAVLSTLSLVLPEHPDRITEHPERKAPA
jgi:hypothetical protein